MCCHHTEDWRSNTKSPGPGWPGVQRCCPHFDHKVSLRLPLSGGHAPASRDLGVIHRWQQRAGTFCDFLRDTPASGSHPASQSPWSVEKQGHCPGRQEGLGVQGHAQVRDMARSPAPPPMCKTLSLSGSSFPHLLNGNNDSYHLGQRKRSKALAPASGHSAVLCSLSAHSCAHPMSWPDPSSAT